MTQKLFRLTRKNQQGKVYTFYYLKTTKTQQWDAKIKLMICIANKDIGARVFWES